MTSAVGRPSRSPHQLLDPGAELVSVKGDQAEVVEVALAGMKICKLVGADDDEKGP